MDYRTRLALVAEQQEAGGPLLHAVARYEPGEAAGTTEIAIVVEDAWQHRGLGTILLDALLAAAEARGLNRFTADVMADNRPMLRVLTRLAHIGRRVTSRPASSPSNSSDDSSPSIAFTDRGRRVRSERPSAARHGPPREMDGTWRVFALITSWRRRRRTGIPAAPSARIEAMLVRHSAPSLPALDDGALLTAMVSVIGGPILWAALGALLASRPAHILFCLLGGAAAMRWSPPALSSLRIASPLATR